MPLICVGVNHRSAPVELREKLAFRAEAAQQALHVLCAEEGIREALILSTCNRVEIYAAGDAQRAPFVVKNFLATSCQMSLDDLDEHLFVLVSEDAIRHLFRVASSLDAIVVGEPQILGQVKDAYFQASGCRTTGPVLNRCFHHAFSVAKRVRTETAISSSAVSISYAGVELARKIFGDISGMDCLLVGAGEMGELAAKHFMERGARLLVTNRSFDRARRLADKFSGLARDINELTELLTEVDVVLCSTSAPGFVITREMVRQASKSRRYRPLLCIDIAVPRDIDPAAADVDAVYVYDVDDLTQVVEENLESRRAEADAAEDIVRQEVHQFQQRLREQQAVPTIKALRRRLLEIAQAESEKTLVVLGDQASERQKQSVEAMARAIVNKILHGPTTKLRDHTHQRRENDADLLGAVHELFALRMEDVDEDTSAAEILDAFEAADAAGGDVIDLQERTNRTVRGGVKV